MSKAFSAVGRHARWPNAGASHWQGWRRGLCAEGRSLAC
jgi:hypothetical protein